MLRTKRLRAIADAGDLARVITSSGATTAKTDATIMRRARGFTMIINFQVLKASKINQLLIRRKTMRFLYISVLVS